MLVNKIEDAKDTVHQYTNQVIIVSDTITQSNRDYITRDEVLNIFQQNQQHYTDQVNIILVIIGIAVTLLGFIVPIIQYLNNRKYEDDIKETIRSFDDRIGNIDNKIENKVKEKVNNQLKQQLSLIESKFNEELNQIIKNLKNETNIILHIIVGHSYLNAGKYQTTINHLMDAAVLAIEMKDYDNLNRIDNNLKAVRDTLKKHEDFEGNIEPEDEFIMSKEHLYILAKNDLVAIRILDNIFKTINEIFSINESNDKKDEDK